MGEPTMIFRMKVRPSSVLRPRVKPDPGQAAELQRRMSSLDYTPENGFHRDHRQDRQARFAMRTVTQR
jgi:hypothetical protein